MELRGERGPRKHHRQYGTRQPWTAEQDAALIKLVAQYGKKNWNTISECLNKQGFVENGKPVVRDAKSCRLRWCNQLDPSINKEPFTDEENRCIAEKHRMFGNRWAQIASFLPGRTDNAVKNQWNCKIKKMLGHDSRRQSNAESEYSVGTSAGFEETYQDDQPGWGNVMQGAGSTRGLPGDRPAPQDAVPRQPNQQDYQDYVQKGLRELEAMLDQDRDETLRSQNGIDASLQPIVPSLDSEGLGLSDADLEQLENSIDGGSSGGYEAGRQRAPGSAGNGRQGRAGVFSDGARSDMYRNRPVAGGSGHGHKRAWQEAVRFQVHDLLIKPFGPVRKAATAPDHHRENSANERGERQQLGSIQEFVSWPSGDVPEPEQPRKRQTRPADELAMQARVNAQSDGAVPQSGTSARGMTAAGAIHAQNVFDLIGGPEWAEDAFKQEPLPQRTSSGDGPGGQMRAQGAVNPAPSNDGSWQTGARFGSDPAQLANVEPPQWRMAGAEPPADAQGGPPGQAEQQAGRRDLQPPAWPASAPDRGWGGQMQGVAASQGWAPPVSGSPSASMEQPGPGQGFYRGMEHGYGQGATGSRDAFTIPAAVMASLFQQDVPPAVVQKIMRAAAAEQSARQAQRQAQRDLYMAAASYGLFDMNAIGGAGSFVPDANQREFQQQQQQASNSWGDWQRMAPSSGQMWNPQVEPPVQMSYDGAPISCRPNEGHVPPPPNIMYDPSFYSNEGLDRSPPFETQNWDGLGHQSGVAERK
ncbi:unnamed protein product [Pedinophyceae sp. YPF-701]|nr:unnamed protein product [Pedinophyceae sp. YPF-701]